MKRKRTLYLILALMVIFVIIVTTPTFAAAAPIPADGEAPAVTIPEEGFNLDMLGSFTLCVLLIIALTEGFKLKFNNINPIWFTFGWTIIIMAGRYLFVTPATTLAEWYTAGINSIFAMLSAMGAFDLGGKKLETFLLGKFGTNTNSGGSADAQ